MPTIHEMKEQELLQTPVLLFDCELRDGRRERWATHRVEMDGQVYPARLVEHSGFDIRSYSEDGIDASAKVSVTLANADSRYSQIEREVGFKGARLSVRFAFFDLANGAEASEAITLFRGTGNAPDQIRESTLRVAFNNRLNFQRVLLPEVRIQKRCPWMFPATAAQRSEGMDGGPRGAYSPFFRCGYSAGEPGGVGNLNGAVPYTSCDYTRKSCEERGMFRADGAANISRRFGGVEFVPSSTLVRGYGDKAFAASAVQANEAKYNDFVPLVYGTCWVAPPVTLARNDGNLTRMEVLLAMGEIEGVLKVVVNDVEIPLAADGTNMTGTGWYHLVSRGNRTGTFNLNFTDGAGEPVGDPYGSMAYLSTVVPSRIQDGKSLPRVQVLLQGAKLPTYDTGGEFAADTFTNNPAWVLLDVLRRSGWRVEEIDLASFAATALYCDDPIETVDLHGSTVTTPRFQCNLALRRRRSAADVVRGIRTGAGLYLTFGPGGLLQLRQESTIGVQQAAKPAPSNAIEQILGGWPAYEFSESEILRAESGEPRLRLYSRNSADTPNRYSVEFQDAFNEYQQDSLSLVDMEDVADTGQETSAALPALGLANFDQAARMMKLQLLKSVRGNVYVEFETSVKALGLTPGDLITLTYAREGFLRQMFRVIRVMPGQNFRTVQITAQWHEDAWYVQTAGNGAESSGRQPKYELGLPRPLSGSVRDEEGEPQFEVTETFLEQSDGTAKVRLAVGFTAPAKPAVSKAGIPLLALSAATQDTGGTLRGGQTLYYAVTGVDEEGREGGLSFVARAVIPAGSDSNRVTLTGLSFGPGTSRFHVYRGATPQQLARVAADVARAASFADDGLPAGLIPPPDENFAQANFYWRLELQGEQVAGIVTANSIGNEALYMLTGEWRGKVVRIVSGKGAGQERRIEGNSTTVCTLLGAWSVVPDNSSKWVVAEPSWVAGASAEASPATFEIPNQEGVTVHVTGRSANAGGRECLAELSLVTRWRVLGASGALLDEAVAPAPTFALNTIGDGTVELQSVGFESLLNTRTVSAGTLVLRYWDELKSPSTAALASALSAEGDTISLTGAAGVSAGQYLQIESELLEVLEVNEEGTTAQVQRGSHGTSADGYEAGTTVYALEQKTQILPFGRDFFGSPASGSFAFNVRLPSARVAAADLYLTNSRGDSLVSKRNVTGTTDYGLRTLQGGQLSLQVEGWLAIEDDATPPLVVERTMAVRDIFATVQSAPTIGPVVLRLRQDAEEICTLTIPAGQTMSDVAEGVELKPLRSGARLRLDILSVAQTASSTPGSNLTVTIRL